jgi:peptide/nickel transport system substrate-binding protein
MAENYWDRYWTQRTSRRRLLGGASALAAGAAGFALVGCGDDDDDDEPGGTDTPAGGQTPGSSPGASPSATPKPNIGGTLRYPFMGMSSGDPPTLFPYENLTYLAQHPASMHYSRLLRSQNGPDIDGNDFTKLEGDVSSKWEQPDDKTYIFTLKPNIKFHQKAPMNGRAMTAQDLLLSYGAFMEKSQNATGWKAVVDKVEAPDEKTFKITLKQPFAPFLTTHASSTEAFWIIPVESIDGGQAKTDPVGTGPYVFDSWETGVAINWDRFTDYYDKDYAHYDRVEGAMLKDPQRIIAALKAGEFDLSGLSGTVSTDAHSSLDPKGQEIFELPGSLGGFYFNFDNPPWRDIRVRQALSMAMDRPNQVKVLDQTGKGDGHSQIAASLSPYWMSPISGKEWGDAAKYWKHDPAEAKKLLQAATGSDTLKFKIIANIDRYGEAMRQNAELLQSVIKKSGFEAELEYMEYGAYIQSIFLGKIPAGAVGCGPLIGSPRDPDDNFMRNFHSTAARKNWGGTPIDEQAEIDGMFDKQRTILDLKERIAYIKDIQRRLAVVQNMVPYTATSNYYYVQPWVKNYHHKSGYAIHMEAIMKSSFTDERLKKG